METAPRNCRFLSLVVVERALIETRKTISTTEIFPLWTPLFSAKKSSGLEQGGVCFLLSSQNVAGKERPKLTTVHTETFTN